MEARGRGGGGHGRRHGRGSNTGRGAVVQPMAYATATSVASVSGQEPVTTVPSVTADQWKTFRALLASVKNGSTKKLLSISLTKI